MASDKAIASAVKKFNPSIHLNEKELPAMKKWKVGSEYDMIIHTKMVSSNIDMNGDPMMEMPATKSKNKKPMMSGRFEVISVDAPGGSQEINEDEYSDTKIKMLEEKAKE